MNISISRMISVSLVAAMWAVALCGAGQAALTNDVSPEQAFLFQQKAAPLQSDQFDHQPSISAPRLQLAFADNTTDAVIRQLQRGAAECSRLEPVYRIDCLRRVYSVAAGATGNRRDYSAANSALRRLSRQLNGIVRQNLDRKAGKAKIGRQSYRAVSRDALRAANRLASQAIQETKTKLLRSAGNSKKRKVHYTRIANAVNSTKKILRS